MEEFTRPPSVFDTYVPGLLSSQTAAAVGALRAAAFELVPAEDHTVTLHLRYYWPPGEDDPSVQRQAEVLRRFIVPRLIDPKDCVIEIPEKAGPIFRRFLLLLMVRDPRQQQQLRGVGALVVDCTHQSEAERRLLKLKEMAVG
jgi:hypothetical protein